MIFRYQGHERFTVYFDNPNQFAALVLCILFASYVAYLTVKDVSRLWRYLFWLTFCPLALVLVSTYSRGAWVACAVLTAVLVIRFRNRWKSHLALTAILTTSLVAIPAGVSRSADIANFKDAAVTNRVITWQAVGEMLLAVVPTKVARSDFVHFYPAYYQPQWMRAKNADTLNTFLGATLHQGLGIGAMAAAAFCFCLLLFVHQTARWCLVPGATVVGIGCAGMFTDMFSSSLLAITYLVSSLAALLGFWIEAGFRNLIRSAAGASGLSIAIGCAFAVVVLTNRDSEPPKYSHTRSAHGNLFYLSNAAREENTRAILLITDNLSDLQLFDRHALRMTTSLANVVVVVPASPRTLLQVLDDASQASSETIVVAVGSYGNRILDQLATPHLSLPRNIRSWILFDCDPLFITPKAVNSTNRRINLVFSHFDADALPERPLGSSGSTVYHGRTGEFTLTLALHEFSLPGSLDSPIRLVH